jgi:alpha-tubulin suppressor-like RCC1 family protein
MHTDNDAPPAKKPKLSNKNDVSIFAVGSNEFGQLGIDHNVSISIEPCKIAVPDSPDTVKLIGCGFSHTVVVTGADSLYLILILQKKMKYSRAVETSEDNWDLGIY